LCCQAQHFGALTWQGWLSSEVSGLHPLVSLLTKQWGMSWLTFLDCVLESTAFETVQVSVVSTPQRWLLLDKNLIWPASAFDATTRDNARWMQWLVSCLVPLSSEERREKQDWASFAHICWHSDKVWLALCLPQETQLPYYSILQL
jgi:hypothetical protein